MTATLTPASTITRTSTWRDDLLCSLTGMWLIGGLYLDGWAHVHRPDLETFFTPWHAVLYSGFAALAAALLAPTLRRRRVSPAPRDWAPPGYGLGLLGAALFAAGGLADTAWHQVLGIEVNLEALLSPPHLALLTGGILMITTAVRATVAREGGLPAGPLRALPAIAALAVVAATAAFFLSYVSPFTDLPAVSLPHDWQALGLAQYLVGTAVLVVPVLTGYALGRRIPPGLITAVVAAVALPAGVFTDFRWPGAQLGAVAGAVVADTVVQAVAARAPQLTAPAAGAAIPLLVWAGHLAGVAATVGIGWSVEMWAGVVVLTALAGTVLGGLSRPSARPAPPPGQRRL